ncbi:MAG: outer membrane beta-barrel protein [Xanthobacteraceae bacterium]|nr:outer membrane beta-barrel protein [Xanthobacteraceae bacterium]
MKRFLMIAAVAAVGATSANAADLAATIYSKAPAFTWTGFYVGGNVGAIWSNDPSFGVSTPGTGAPFFGPADAALIGANGSGTFGRQRTFTFGAQAGYNYQLDRTVFGFEVDEGRWSLNRNITGTVLTAGGLETVNTSLTSDILVTFRARLGYTFDRSLFYVTGGGAYANITYAQSTSFAGVPTVDNATSKSGQLGWTIGAGAEYAIDPHWSVKGEYLYVAFPSRNFTTNPVAPVGAPATVPFTHTVSAINANIAKLGVNYRFD